MKKVILLLAACLFLFSGCKGNSEWYNVGDLAIEIPNSMNVSLYKDEKDSDELFYQEAITVNLIQNRYVLDDPEGYLLAMMSNAEITEEKYADKLQGQTVNEHFLAQEGIVQRVVDSVINDWVDDVKIQGTTYPEVGDGIRALRVDFTGTSAMSDQRTRQREYCAIQFYDQGREYRVVAYWDADAPKDQKDMMQAMLDSLALR